MQRKQKSIHSPTVSLLCKAKSHYWSNLIRSNLKKVKHCKLSEILLYSRLSRSDSINFLPCRSRSIPLTSYQGKHLKFAYMLHSQRFYAKLVKHLLATRKSKWRPMSLQVLSWYCACINHVQNKVNLTQLQIHEIFPYICYRLKFQFK